MVLENSCLPRNCHSYAQLWIIPFKWMRILQRSKNVIVILKSVFFSPSVSYSPANCYRDSGYEVSCPSPGNWFKTNTIGSWSISGDLCFFHKYGMHWGTFKAVHKEPDDRGWEYKGDWGSTREGLGPGRGERGDACRALVVELPWT